MLTTCNVHGEPSGETIDRDLRDCHDQNGQLTNARMQGGTAARMVECKIYCVEAEGRMVVCEISQDSESRRRKVEWTNAELKKAGDYRKNTRGMRREGKQI